jgi:putative DNA primase/helicase
MSSPENYVDAATNNVVAIIADCVSSSRKHARNGAGFGMTTHTSITALLLGPRYNGYVKEQCESPARVEGPVGNGQQSPPVDQNAKQPLSSPASVGQPDAPPRNAIVEPRLVAPLTSDPGPDQQMAAAIPEQQEVVAAAEANAVTAERNNVRLYGRHAAQTLSKGRRDVALASSDVKRTVYQEVVRSISQAVADQWLPKAVMVDWLMDIARAHGSFGLNSDQLQQLISDAAVVIPVSKKPPASAPLKRRLITHRASDLQPEKLVWVWPGRIPEGKLVLLGGPPGLGKSQLTAFMSAIVSNGGHWPCGEGSTIPGDVIFMSAEDGVQDTIIPRLMAAGADRERVHIVSAATKPDGSGRKTFSLKTDVDLLEDMAKKIGSVRLIIVDPISAYMGGSDGNGNVETREVLEPLADMANRLRIAVVAVTHLNKGGGGTQQSALNRFAGSIAFVAAARAAFAVIEDPEDDNRRLFLQAKNNLGPKCKGLAFRMEQRLIPGDILSSNIFFESEHVTQSIDEALTASESRVGGGQTSSKEDAAEFLAEILAYGPVDVLEVERQARAATLLDEDKRLRQNKVFRDARKDLGVLSIREGFGPGSRYVLSLPGTPCAPKNSMRARAPEGAHMGNPGAHDAGRAFSGAQIITGRIARHDEEHSEGPVHVPSKK